MAKEPDWNEMYAVAEFEARRLTRDRDQIEEYKSLGIEKLLTVWTKYDESGPANFKTWASRVMRNAMLDEVRKSKRTGKSSRFELLPDCTGSTKAEKINLYFPSIENNLLPSEKRVASAFIKHGEISYEQIAQLAQVRNKESVRVHVCNIFKKIEAVENGRL